MDGFREIVRRPIVGIVLCFALGVWFGLIYDGPYFSPAGAYPAALLSFYLFWLVRRRGSRFAAVCFLGAACVLAGTARAGSYRRAMIPWQERFPGDVQLKGVVINDPEIVSVRADGGAMWEFSVRVQEACRAGGEIEPVQARTRIRWLSSRSWDRIPEYGESWILAGHWASLQKSAAGKPVFSTHAGKSAFVSSGLGWAFVSNCYRLRQAAARRSAMGIEKHTEVVAVIHGLLLGYYRLMPPDIRDAFVRTGTLHVFAVSGQHVGILCLFLVFGLKVFGISKVRWILFLAPLLIGYTLATGARASAVRACIMGITYYLAPWIGRRADGLTAMGLAGLLILGFQPDQLQDVGCIYSFVAVGGLFLFYPIFARMLSRLWMPDPLRVQEESRVAQWARGAGRYMCELMAMTLSAWLVSTPLTAYFFGYLSPVALVSNLLVIPMVGVIMLTGAVSILLGSCIGFLGLLLNHANLAPVTLLLHGVSRLSRIPFGYLEVSRLPFWGLVLSALGILGLRVVLFRLFPVVGMPADSALEKENRGPGSATQGKLDDVLDG